MLVLDHVGPRSHSQASSPWAKALLTTADAEPPPGSQAHSTW